MRVLGAIALATVFLAGPAVRADDPPKGAIGVVIEAVDGKLMIKSTTVGGPAEKAGVKPGDILVKVGGRAVKQKDADKDELDATIAEVVKHKPGDKLKVTVRRPAPPDAKEDKDGKEHTFEVTLGKRGDLLPGSVDPLEKPKDKPKDPDKPKDTAKPKEDPKDLPKDKPRERPKDKPKEKPDDKPTDTIGT